MSAGKDDRDRESERIIRRIGQESDGSPMATVRRTARRTARRAGDHMAGADADQNDTVEVWGIRIGRALGLALFAYLIYWLISFLVRGV